VTPKELTTDNEPQQQVLFDRDDAFDLLDVNSQEWGTMSRLASHEELSHSGAPRVARRLNFSHLENSSDLYIEESKEPPRRNLQQLLGKAFLTLLGQRARLESEMQVAITRVETLNGNTRPLFHIAPNIGGNLTKVRYNDLDRIREVLPTVTQISR